ncbi:MAG: spermidine synthase [Pirellula sp.]
MKLGVLLIANSFLLFLVQPIMGKTLLPGWGGGSHVWTSCLLFFQSGLLLGYLYAYAASKCLSVPQQTRLHLVLMIMSWAWLPIQSNLFANWGIELVPNDWDPVWHILTQLTFTVGLPYVLLASTSPLFSHWFVATQAGIEPYRWYSLANLGSLVGCLLYPFLVEPTLRLPEQDWIWSVAFGMLSLGLIGHTAGILRAAHMHPNTQPQASQGSNRDQQSTPLVDEILNGNFLVWGTLSACSSIVLAASTSNASQTGIVVPGLWVIPLAMYLASWCIGFRSLPLDHWATHMCLYFLGGALAVFLLIFKLWLPWMAIVAGYMVVVFTISMACHNMLYSLRPQSKQITSFYLAIALGGAVGSGFVSIVAPRIFDEYWELHVGLSLGAAVIALHYGVQMFPKIRSDVWVRRFRWPATVLAAIFLIGVLAMHMNVQSIDPIVSRQRDFYGVVSVVEQPKLGLRTMLHGQTRHGSEPLQGPLDPDQTMYYQTNSGVAKAWQWIHEKSASPRRVGIIGLGTGSLSLYANPEDHLIYYEVSPAVRSMAQDYFRYLAAHPGVTEIHMGDGRRLIAEEVRMADEPMMDMLVVDAFANDSLPMHLLTVEAIELYRKRLSKDGLIAMNITNRNLDLAPVLMQIAKRCQLQAVLMESPLERMQDLETPPTNRSMVRWLLLFPPDVSLPQWEGQVPIGDPKNLNPWTDDFGSPFHALRWVKL